MMLPTSILSKEESYWKILVLSVRTVDESAFWTCVVESKFPQVLRLQYVRVSAMPKSNGKVPAWRSGSGSPYDDHGMISVYVYGITAYPLKREMLPLLKQATRHRLMPYVGMADFSFLEERRTT